MKTRTQLATALGSLAMIPLLPGLAFAEDVPRASREFELTPHAHYDQVLHEVFVDLTVIGVIFSIIAIYFMVAYRRKSKDEVGNAPKLSTQAKLGWLIIPAALFVADDIFLFAKAWDLHDNYRNVPQNAYEIKTTGSLWSWEYEYPNGVKTNNELIVEVGQPVLLRMTSTDVVHSHYMQKYRVTEDLMPGRITYQWFMPDEVGESVVTCREYCGMLHSGMFGTIKVLPKEEFDTWMTGQVASLEKETSEEVAAVSNEVLPTSNTEGGNS